VTKQDLIETLYDFLLGLSPLKASAVLIIDEAQNLPLPVLEQIRILSNLETDKEKLLQIILVGQLNLGTLLRSPELRQLDQRVSIRYELEPLDRETLGAYVAHRLTIAGGSGAVSFASEALDLLYRLSGGIPRLINLVCDRALLAAFSVRENRITPDMVAHAAEGLDVRPSPPVRVAQPGASLAGAAAVMLAAAAFAVGSTAYLYQRFADRPMEAAAGGTRIGATALGTSGVRAATTPVSRVSRALPADALFSILVDTYPLASAGSEHTVGNIRALAEWLEMSGYAVYSADVDLGAKGRWQRILAGAYTDRQAAQREATRLNAVVPGAHARVIDAAAAGSAVD
jgi:hypothetical protein